MRLNDINDLIKHVGICMWYLDSSVFIFSEVYPFVVSVCLYSSIQNHKNAQLAPVVFRYSEKCFDDGKNINPN